MHNLNSPKHKGFLHGSHRFEENVMMGVRKVVPEHFELEH